MSKWMLLISLLLITQAYGEKNFYKNFYCQDKILFMNKRNVQKVAEDHWPAGLAALGGVLLGSNLCGPRSHTYGIAIPTLTWLGYECLYSGRDLKKDLIEMVISYILGFISGDVLHRLQQELRV